MGGIGKTIMAQALCHDTAVQAAFPDGLIWITIGEKPPDLLGQIRDIAKSLGDQFDYYDTLAAGANRLRTLLCGKAVRLVLDDVWDVRHVEPFRVDSRFSKLLITTRSSLIAAALGCRQIELDVLTREQSLEVLTRWSARQSGTGFPPDAVQLIYECGHLPLAIAMIGAMMRGKGDHRWTDVLNRLRTADLSCIGLQFPDYPYPNLLRAIHVSVEVLKDLLHSYYLDFAVFPDDTPIPNAALGSLWCLPEGEARRVADEFLDLSLAIRDGHGRLMLHDVQMLYVRRKRMDHAVRLHEKLLGSYWRHCPSGWVSGPNDGYFYEHLPYHLLGAERSDELRTLLLTFEWLEAKLHFVNAYALIMDCGLFPDDQVFNSIQSALRLALFVLERDKSQLPTQLAGRLADSALPEIRQLLAGVGRHMNRPWFRLRGYSLDQPGTALLFNLYHDAEVTAVTISADGCRAAAGSVNGQVRLWDLRSGRTLMSFGKHEALQHCSGDHWRWTTVGMQVHS